MSKSKNRSKFDEPVGEGTNIFYNKPKKFASDAKHGYLAKKHQNLNPD